ncbi:MBL fold metallo-hydrolase [Parablastomonas sp. CN1-191]|uniref:MBL fold metallo-hydrolase n=1 Tax=Parablastomonas sp. CN1-191 TaxID=3400908 RepID=UPI003BF86B8E
MYLIDCPNGVAGQLVKAGFRLNRLSQVFVTHDHSDHVLDAGSLAVLAWGSDLDHPIRFHGPPPLKQIVSRSVAASDFDTAARMREEGRPPLKPLVQVHETRNGGVVYEDARVKVTSAFVDHYTVRPAFAYRFDTSTRSVVISGDTTYSDRLVNPAKGADLLIHEAMYLPGVDQLAAGNDRLKDHLLRSHSHRAGRSDRGARRCEEARVIASRPGISGHNGRNVAARRSREFQGRSNRRPRSERGLTVLSIYSGWSDR